MLLEILIAANLVISIIGALIVGRWVYALKGTVAAQAATIATIQQVNETVVRVFTALDPERWAKEVTVHKELADRKAAALVEEAERKFREEKTAFSSLAREAINRMSDHYGEALEMAFRFMPWVPKSQRALVIAQTKLPDNVKATMTEMAAESPEWGAGGVDLGSLFRSTLTASSTGTAGALPSFPSAEGTAP